MFDAKQTVIDALAASGYTIGGLCRAELRTLNKYGALVFDIWYEDDDGEGEGVVYVEWDNDDRVWYGDY